MTLEEFDELRNAIELVQNNKGIDKLEGKKWKVYRVGIIIRIDLNN